MALGGAQEMSTAAGSMPRHVHAVMIITTWQSCYSASVYGTEFGN
jgi:hypothetical protein